jgi:hypothetical protein
MLRWCTICKSMYNDSINRTSTHDNLGSLIAEKLQNNRVFLLFCLKKNGDSRFVQSSFMCSLLVDYCLSALFCSLSIRFPIKAAECPFGNFILLNIIICEWQPVLDTEVYPVVMQASQLIWRSSWWWSYGCWIYNYMCSQ